MILVVHLLTLFSLCQKQKLERGQENESWIISAEQQLKKNEEQQIHSEFTDDRPDLCWKLVVFVMTQSQTGIKWSPNVNRI